MIKGEDRVEGVLYECGFEFRFMFLVPLLVFVGMIISAVVINNDMKRKGSNALVRKIANIFMGGLALFVFICIILGIEFRIDLYKKTVLAYQKGEYQIVEGYVENFQPMGQGGPSPESFEINGIKFYYSKYKMVPGYYKGDTQGDFILGDGQHLKIGYVYYGYDYGNIIVYIEALP